MIHTVTLVVTIIFTWKFHVSCYIFWNIGSTNGQHVYYRSDGSIWSNFHSPCTGEVWAWWYGLSTLRLRCLVLPCHLPSPPLKTEAMGGSLEAAEAGLASGLFSPSSFSRLLCDLNLWLPPDNFLTAFCQPDFTFPFKLFDWCEVDSLWSDWLSFSEACLALCPPYIWGCFSFSMEYRTIVGQTDDIFMSKVLLTNFSLNILTLTGHDAALFLDYF